MGLRRSFSRGRTSRYSSMTAMLIFHVSIARRCISVQSAGPLAWIAPPETIAWDEPINNDRASPLAGGFALRHVIQAAEGFYADTEEERGNQLLV